MTNAGPVLIDTDILSAIMRKHTVATRRARAYLELHRSFTFSIITRYEILRGLFVKGATKQLVTFDHVCAAGNVLPITDVIVVQAAEIYADLHRRGELISDADILIAATAVTHGLGLATNNEAHFRRIRNIRIENWTSAGP